MRGAFGPVTDSPRRALAPGLVALATTISCATAGGVGSVDLAAPEPVHGDETAIAWPFVVTHGGETEILAGFRLVVREGGALVGVRPDAENPDPDAIVEWRGRVEEGSTARWSGGVVPPGNAVRLWIMVRPTGDGDPTLRVVHQPLNGRGEAIAEPVCEVWRYAVATEEVDRRGC